MQQDINDTLTKMKAAIVGANGGAEVFNKSYTQSLGLQNYDLEAGAKLLFPWGAEMTPLRNEVTRRKGNGDVAHRWKAITGINTTKLPPGVSEGNRSGVITTTEVDKLSSYAGLGLEDYVTFEAQYAAEGFDGVLALASENLLKATMISEEGMILGGNSTIALGAPGTIVLSTASTGGALSNATYYVGVVALTNDGWSRATVAAGVVQQIVRSNADGSTDTINGGTSTPSAVQNSVLSGGTATQTLGMTVPAVQGAVAYAWYIGTAANHQYLAAITTLNSYLHITAAPANTQQDFQTLAAADYSKIGTYGFDGLLYQTGFASTSNAYYLALATGTAGTGTQFSTDNAGGIKEINTLLKDRWDNYKASPDTIWCNSQEILSIKNIVVKNGGAPLVRMVGDFEGGVMNLTAGAVVGFYLNPVTMKQMRIRVHPFQSPGTVLFTSKEAPYAGSRVATLVEMRTRQEYYSTLWPQRTRKREYGVYVDETLCNYFPPAFGVITNVAPTTS